MDEVNLTPISADSYSLASTGDAAFDAMLKEAEALIEDTRNFILPDDMVDSAIKSACEFFGLPEIPVVNNEGTCVWPNNPFTPYDDVFGFDRKELMQMGIYGEDALRLVFTHECGHRALQSFGIQDSWVHELACDYFAGVRAMMQEIDTTHYKNSLADSPGAHSHPTGMLRIDFIEYGGEIVQEMVNKGIRPTFENCLDLFNKHLLCMEEVIQNQRSLFN